jgi:hypothetical protein
MRRTAAYQKQTRQQLDHIMLFDAEGYFRNQTLSRKLVDHIDDVDLSAIFQPVLHNVIAPDVVHILWRTSTTGVQSVAVMTFRFLTLLR